MGDDQPRPRLRRRFAHRNLEAGQRRHDRRPRPAQVVRKFSTLWKMFFHVVEKSPFILGVDHDEVLDAENPRQRVGVADRGQARRLRHVDFRARGGGRCGLASVRRLPEQAVVDPRLVREEGALLFERFAGRDRRPVVGHVEHRRHPALQRRGRAVGDAFLVGLARLAQMHVRVDQSRHDDFVAARRVGGEIAFQLRDAAVGDPDRPAMEPPVVAQPAGVVDLELHSHSMVPGGLVVTS